MGRTGEQQRSEALHGAPLTAAAFLGTDEVVLVAGAKGLVASRKTDGSNGASYGGSSGFVHALATTADGELIVAGGETGHLRVWRKDATQVAQFTP